MVTRLPACFLACLFAGALGGAAVATTVTGTLLRRAPEKAASAIDRYPSRGGSARSGAVAPEAPAVVYLVGQAAGPFTPPSERPQMLQRDQTFQPPVLPILVGTTVDFPNLDPVYHNVFSYSKARKFDLGRYPKGKSKSVTFDTPGLIKVFCEIHPSMRAHILVLEQPYFAVTGPDGHYRIPNVPPGEYVLKVWQEQLPDIEMKVTVPAQESVVVDVR
ncbi:MAG: hypothetical protein IT585_02925 [candidate division Zixibacteria bacterium]|nr:hypothetical protein [candidate division Zixibacteria bacterium]